MYGKIKVMIEDITFKSTADWMVIRPILMYGWPHDGGRGNWATRVINALKSGKALKLVTDSYSQPTYAGDVANAIWTLIEKGEWRQVYNVACDDKVSIYGFGKEIESMFKKQVKITKSKLSDFNTIAPRPIDTTFNTAKIRSYDIKMSNMVEGLEKMKSETTTKI